MSSATITYVHAHPSTSRSVSAIAGAEFGSSTRRTIPRASAPSVYAASTRSRRVPPTVTATISTIWKNEPMKITSSFCSSPMPAHRINNGMNAEAGR